MSELRTDLPSLCTFSALSQSSRDRRGCETGFSFLGKVKVKTHEGQRMGFALLCSSRPQLQFENKPEDLYYWEYLGHLFEVQGEIPGGPHSTTFLRPLKEVI